MTESSELRAAIKRCCELSFVSSSRARRLAGVSRGGKETNAENRGTKERKIEIVSARSRVEFEIRERKGPAAICLRRNIDREREATMSLLVLRSFICLWPEASVVCDSIKKETKETKRGD